MPKTPPRALNRPVARYAIAVVAPILGLLFRLAIQHEVGQELPTYVTFYPAVFLTAVFAGFGPCLVSTVFSGLIADYFIIPPVGHLGIERAGDALALAIFVSMGVLIGWLAERNKQSEKKLADFEREQAVWEGQQMLQATERRLAVTLRSIGDAVMATDADGKIAFVNAVAESLLQCTLDECAGRPIDAVFKLESEKTGSAVESPVAVALRENRVVELENSVALIGDKGKRTPIADSAAPIRDDDGNITGVVLVFRDVAERRARNRERDEALLREKLARQVAEETTERLHKVQLVTEAALAHLPFQKMLNRLLARIVEALQTDAAVILLLGEQTRMLEVSAAVGLDEELIRDVRIPLGAGISGTIAETGRPLVVDDLKEFGAFSPFLREKISSLIGVPLVVEGRVVGVIHVDSRKPRKFTESETALLQMVADRVAVAIERKRADEAMRESEQRLRMQMERMPIGYIVFDRQNCFSQLNPAAERIFGYTATELCGRHANFIVPEVARPHVDEIMRRLAEGDMTAHSENENVTKEGRSIICQWTNTPLRDGAGNFIGFLSMVQDITERKRADEALRERDAELKATEAMRAERQRFLDVLDRLPPMVCLLTSDHHVAWSNRSFREKFGEPQGRPCFEFCFGNTEPCEFCESYKVLETGQPHRWEVKGPDGSVIDAHDFPFTDVDGSPMILEMDVDITERRRSEAELARYRKHLEEMVEERTLQLENANTELRQEIAERKRAEDALREREERLNLTVKAAEIGTWDFNPVTGKLIWSDRCKALFGLSPEIEVNYQTFLDRLHPDDRERTHVVVQRALDPAGVGEYDTEYRTVWPDGTERWIAATGKAHFGEVNGQYRAGRFIGTVLDITARKRAEEALRQSLERLERVLEVETVGVMFWDLNTGCMVDANGAFLKLMGYSRSEVEARELTWQKLTPPEYMDASRAEIEKFLVTGRVGPYEKEYVRKDGTRQWLLFAGSSLGENQCVEFCVDIADRKKAEEALRESEGVLRTVTDHAHVGLVMLDENRQYVFANGAYCDVLRLPKGNVVGKRVSDVMGHVYDQISPKLDRAFAGEQVNYELVVPGRDGAGDRFYAITYEPRRGVDKVTGVIVVVVDLTERKRAEEALRESEQRFRTLANAIPQLCWMANADGWIFWYNERWYGYTGTTPEQMEGWGWQSVHDPETLPAVLERWQDSIATGMPFDMVFPLLGADGVFRPFLTRVVPIKDGYGKVVRWFGTNTDVTELRDAQEALRESEQRFRELADAMPQIVWASRPDGSLDYYNRKWYELTGAEEGAHGDQSWLPILHPDDRQKCLDIWYESVRTGNLYQIEYRFKFPSTGEYRWHLGRALPVRDQEGNVIRWYGTCTDIHDFKKISEALRESEERWATTLQSIGDAVISTSNTGEIVFMNEVAQRLTGWPLAEAEGKELTDVFDIVQEVTRIRPENPVAKVLRSGKVVGLANHTLLIRRDGTEIPIEDSGAPIRDREGNIQGVVLVFHDVEDQRKVEKVLRESDRLATTGRLAATIAHEIHNPLDTVGNLLFLIEQSTKEEATRQSVVMAAGELGRVTQMTQQMLTFQRESAKPIPVKITEILESVLALYERKIQYAGVKIEKNFEFEETILAQPGELRQVFANLVGNAIAAVGEDHGSIRISARAARDWRNEHRGVRVLVADNGCGVPAEIREKIFDPFFTTKGESGTGLGLWIATGIVSKYRGTLRLRTTTRPGVRGTCFSVFIPCEVAQEA
jgi:PAS domain S-box-containing protein